MQEKIDVLTSMPNIGKTIAEMMIFAGIDTPEKLYELGTEAAYLQIIEANKRGCLNMLLSIAGAIQGDRWHKLSEEEKRHLKQFYDLHKIEE